MSEGYPVSNSNCDRIFPGRTSPPNGAVAAPMEWHKLLRESGGSSGVTSRGQLSYHLAESWLRCSSTLVPSEAQSVTVMVSEV